MYRTPWLDPRETKEYILVMKSSTALTIHHYITDYRSRRSVWRFLDSSFREEINISIAIQGYIVDWDAQKAVWDGLFSPEVLGVSLEVSESRF